MAADDLSGRRLTPAERIELLDLPLTGVWSTVSSTGGVHAVPVHFVRSGEQVRVLTQRDSVKFRNSVRAGRATLCVHVTLAGDDRRYVTLEGPVRVEPAVQRQDLARLDRKYDRDDAAFFEAPEYRDSVILVLSPERTIAWSDVG